jgi:hypothetical protein
MSSPSVPPEVVSVRLDFGSYELEADDCRELIRILRARGEQPDGAAALSSARCLEALLDTPPEARAHEAPTEDELDAIADAAWDWLRRVGPAELPERVLLMLDVLRARHVHE